MTPGPPLRMPAPLVQRARALAGGSAGDWLPPTPRHAGTVVLVADLADGVHVYLQRRVRTMAFAAGMYVFPGGAVEDVDTQAAEAAGGTVAEPGTDTLDVRFAAVRETQEEAAIRLGDPTRLRYIAHWVTPEVEERRFDTRFYAAVVDVEEVTENSSESDDQLWIRPAVALSRYHAGDMMMLPPTVAVLHDFAERITRGLTATEVVSDVALRPPIPLMPRATIDPGTEDLQWHLVDYLTGDVVESMSREPAGSEVDGASNARRE